MNDNKQSLTEEQMDFLREMMNVGAGNAATALQQMLQRPVDLIIPKVHFIPFTEVQSIFDNPSSPVVCVKMGLMGDMGGGLFFIVPLEYKESLVSMAKRATPGFKGLSAQKLGESEMSALAEIGNIMAGVYLTAVHDFCGLKIYHTVPVLAFDMIQALLDEALIELSCHIDAAMLVENMFVLDENRFSTYLMIVPDAWSIGVLVSSLEPAKKKMYGAT